ncbi:MAG TPA: hypothetical protein VN026_17145, partial [Bacteroidia bacterium]|nr:hypothetical protein [Bacteroidia bacterium]
RLLLLYSDVILLPQRVCDFEIAQIRNWNLIFSFTDEYNERDKQFTWRTIQTSEEQKNIPYTKYNRVIIKHFGWNGNDIETKGFLVLTPSPDVNGVILYIKVRTLASEEVPDMRRVELSIWQAI